MKNIYAVLVVTFCSLMGNAQIVNIPDPVFKAYLISNGVDSNNDGEIQESEAATVINLGFSMVNFNNIIGIQSFVNLQNLSFGAYFSIATPIDITGMSSLKSLHFHKSNFPSINLSGLTGLESLDFGYQGNINLLNFEDLINLKSISFYASSIASASLDLSHSVNLISFSAISFNLDTINLDGLTHLSYFKLEGNSSNITSLNLTDLINLRNFELYGGNLNAINFDNNILLEVIGCSGNNFSTFNISNLTNLTRLSCNSNNLSSLDVSNNINLTYLNCSYNQLSSLDVSNNINLTHLDCSYNQLSSIDLTNSHQLNQVNVSSNLFTTLDFSSLTEFTESNISYYINDNPNLISVNIKNGKRDLVWSNFSYDTPFNCPNLIYVCLDDVDVFSQNYVLQQYEVAAQLNNYCSFIPGGNYNTITGTFTIDNDNNGCDVNDYQYANSKIKIDDITNVFGATYTNSSGNYNFFTQSGSFTITPEFENPYFTVSPESAIINFADSNNNTQTQNFCITPIGIHKDLEISILPIQGARPGFDATYQLVYKNKGNQTLSGNVNLSFDDAVLDFVSSNPALTNQTPNNLNWSYTNLLPIESRTIDFTLNVNSPMETPAVNIGDVFNFTASIDPITDDETTADNTFHLMQTVVGSYDPNDKTCLEGNTIVPEKIGDYLHYLIRFQNSGTAAAENVVIKDVIDTTKFDMASLQLTSASHPYVSRITGNKIEFIFENIQLPAEIENEPASHGFVAFKIKTKSDLVIGNQVTNIADIYFDYNFPIVTEPATSTFELQLGITEIENKAVTVFPNPVNDVLNINASGNISSIQLYDVQGRLIETFMKDDEKATINLSGKKTGVYFVKIYTEKGVKVEKVIKE